MSKKSKKKIINSLHHVPSLRETLERLFAENKINRERKDYIERHLDEWVVDSKYILINLGIHLGVGFIRFTVLPFPLMGSTLRFLWVLVNRIYYVIKNDAHHKKIHSLTVLFFSFIPFLGYFAYTIPLKKKSEYLAYLYVEHISYMLYNKTFENKLGKAPKFIQRIAYALFVPKEKF